MSDSYTLLNAATVAGGDNVDMESVTYGGAPTTRKRTRTVITGTAAAAIADVVNSTPASSAYGLPVRLAGPVVTNTYPGVSDYGLTVRGLVNGDLAHGSAESASSFPLKMGGRARLGGYLDLAVADGQRSYVSLDRYGRQLVTLLDVAQQKWKAASYTSAQTGTLMITPTGGARLAIHRVGITAGGTVTGRATLWFVDPSGGTTYTEGTHMPVVDQELTPTATDSENHVWTFDGCPVFAPAKDYLLRITTSAAINPIRIVLHYSEIETAT